MKKKMGTVIEEGIARKLKEYSARVGRPMGEIIEGALESYFVKPDHDVDLRIAAVRRMCSRPFELSKQDLDEILEQDYYDQ